MIGRLPNIHPFLHTRLQTFLNELFTLIRHAVLLIRWKIHLCCLQHNSLVQHPQLAHFVPKRFLSEQHLVVNHADRPNIDFCSYHRLFWRLKTLRWQVPVRPDPLRSQFNDILFCCLAQSKVRYLDLALVEHDILWFKIVVNNFVRQRVQVPNRIYALLNDHFGLLLWNFLVLF